jgi:hypothetical protein
MYIQIKMVIKLSHISEAKVPEATTNAFIILALFPTVLKKKFLNNLTVMGSHLLFRNLRGWNIPALNQHIWFMVLYHFP